MEADLVVVLKGLCVRTFPDVAPFATARPYITWQAIGGRAWRYTDNTAADKRHTVVQVNVWDDTRAGALTLARQIEEALCAATAFTATPEAEAVSDADTDIEPMRYGTRQDFSIVAAR